MAESRGRFRKIAEKLREGWTAGREPAPPAADANSERFVMKPGEVQIIRGGGSKIDREPGQKRGD